MSILDELTIGFEDKGFNTADSFVDREKELPTKMVSIYDIDFNPLNDANDTEEDKIENAEKIHEQGMVYTPLHVYKNKDKRHGGKNKYMLLGGHFRLDALLRNAEKYDDSQKMIPVIIVPTPKDEIDEQELILLLNEVRPLGDDDYKRKVEMYLKVWHGKEEKGEKPKGIQKRKWIAQRLGNRIGEKKVEKFIHELEGYERSPRNDEIGDIKLADEQEEIMTSADEEILKNIEKNLKESTGRKVKVSKKCAITFYAQNDDMEDMLTILNDLGFTEEGYFK